MKRIIVICLLMVLSMTLFGCKKDTSEFMNMGNNLAEQYNLEKGDIEVSNLYKDAAFYTSEKDDCVITVFECKDKIDADNIFSNLKETLDDAVLAQQLYELVEDETKPVEEYNKDGDTKTYKMCVDTDDKHVSGVIVKDNKSLILVAAFDKKYADVVKDAEEMLGI